MNSIIGSKRKLAIFYRKKGKSYNEINQILNISKSTLSLWLKDLPLSKIIKKQNISKAKIKWSKNISHYNKIRSKKYKKELQKLLKNYSEKVPSFNKNNLFWIGLSLFWAEGGKKEKWNVRFVNSDPDMIKIILKFFRKICNVKDNKIRLRVYLYSDMDEEKTINYWLKITGIQRKQFWKSQIQKSKIENNKYHKLPFGTLHINITDSKLVKKIQGWIIGFKKQINKPR